MKAVGIAALMLLVLAGLVWLDRAQYRSDYPMGPRHLYPHGQADEWLWRQQAIDRSASFFQRDAARVRLHAHPKREVSR